MIRTVIALLVSALLAGACAAAPAPAPVLERGNVVSRSGHGLRTGPLFERFRAAAARAAGCPAGVASTADLACSGRAAAPAEIDDFMRAGYALVYAECDGYFAELSRGRRRALRDLGIAPPMIDAVRGLVLRALVAHAQATSGNGVDPSTFARAVIHIQDNQSICAPANIQVLIREALARPGDAASR